MNSVEIETGILPDEAVQAFRNAQRVPLLLGIVTALLMFIVGVFFFLKPDMVWRTQHRFTVENGEPTRFYLISTRITGLVFIGLGIVCVILTITGQ